MRVQKVLQKARRKETYGSSFVGYLEANYAFLVKRFGKPHDRAKEGPWRSGDGKVRVEWALKLGGSRKPCVFTIYDYKDPLPVQEVSTWHVGAKGDLKKMGRVFEAVAASANQDSSGDE